MKLGLLKNLMHALWLYLGIAFWATLAFVRGLESRYLAWKYKRAAIDLDNLKATLEALNQKTRD